jgi:hypothetical protein
VQRSTKLIEPHYEQHLTDVFVLSLGAIFNPALLAAVAVMLLFPNPEPVMVGYLLGALTTSISLGLLIALSLSSPSAISTVKHTISPAEDIIQGLLLLLIAFVLGTGRDRPFDAGGRQPTESLPLRMPGKGDPRVAFGVGAVLTSPGVSYLLALQHIAKLNPGTVPTVLLVVGFCLIQQIFLELPLLGFAFAPESTLERATLHPLTASTATPRGTSRARWSARGASGSCRSLAIEQSLAALPRPTPARPRNPQRRSRGSASIRIPTSSPARGTCSSASLHVPFRPRAAPGR